MSVYVSRKRIPLGPECPLRRGVRLYMEAKNALRLRGSLFYLLHFISAAHIYDFIHIFIIIKMYCLYGAGNMTKCLLTRGIPSTVCIYNLITLICKVSHREPTHFIAVTIMLVLYLRFVAAAILDQ